MAYNTYMAHNRQYDAIIIGGGLVGAAQAIALARTGFSVGLIDALSHEVQLKETFDGRTIAVADASKTILDNLGIWEHIEEKQPIDDIRVCDQGSRATLHFDHTQVGDAPFGYIVENRLLRKALFSQLKDYNTITCYVPDKTMQVERDADGVTVELESGKTLNASLLIAADGKFSKTREKAGIETEIVRYKQDAIVFTVGHEKPHNGLAVEKFMPVGPFAVLPLTGNRSGIVWTVEERMTEHYLSLSDQELMQDVTSRVGDFLGKLTLMTKPYSHPLVLLKAHRYVDQRLALVGDSAHAIHPIAGQGVNVGYRDVAVLTDLLKQQASLGLDIGAQTVLENYEQKRRFDVKSMSWATDGLNRLFSTNNPLITHARRMGLDMVNHSPRAKQFFMRHAMGQIGVLPPLMQQPEERAA